MGVPSVSAGVGSGTVSSVTPKTSNATASVSTKLTSSTSIGSSPSGLTGIKMPSQTEATSLDEVMKAFQQRLALQILEMLTGDKCEHDKCSGDSAMEMLGKMGTTAMQTLWAKQAEGRRAGAMRMEAPPPGLLDSCYAYRRDGPVIGRKFPDYAEGG